MSSFFIGILVAWVIISVISGTLIIYEAPLNQNFSSRKAIVFTIFGWASVAIGYMTLGWLLHN